MKLRLEEGIKEKVAEVKYQVPDAISVNVLQAFALLHCHEEGHDSAKIFYQIL